MLHYQGASKLRVYRCLNQIFSRVFPNLMLFDRYRAFRRLKNRHVLLSFSKSQENLRVRQLEVIKNYESTFPLRLWQNTALFRTFPQIMVSACLPARGVDLQNFLMVKGEMVRFPWRSLKVLLGFLLPHLVLVLDKGKNISTLPWVA